MCPDFIDTLHNVVSGSTIDVKKVNPKISRNFTCRKCEGNIEEILEQEERLCEKVEKL